MKRGPRQPTELFSIMAVHSILGRVRLKIGGVSDQKIAAARMYIVGRPSIKKAERFTGSNTLLILYDARRDSEGSIIECLREFILQLLKEPAYFRCQEATQEGSHFAPQIRWGGALAGTSVLAMCLSRIFPFPVMAVGIAFVALRPIRRSFDSLVNERKLNIDSLDVAATFAALAVGRPATAAFVIWMVGVGDLLLDLSSNSARNALSQLMQNKELNASRILPDGTVERVAVGLLQVGDRFIVQAGQSIVADGRVVKGQAEVDEKALTGESHLLLKKEHDRVFAYTYVVEGRIVIEVEVVGQDTEVSKIESVLSSVGNKPLTLQRDAIDFGGKLVPPTFGIAGVAGILASSYTPAVCVLVTDFGTGIRISVPTSALTAMTIASREGVLVKGAQYLERMSKVDIIIFDKTGTLTSGEPEVVEVITSKCPKECREKCHGGLNRFELIQLSASVEFNQDHPVAKALRSYAKRMGIQMIEPEAESEVYAVGLGMSARISGHHVQVGRVAWMEDQGLSIEHLRKDIARLRSAQVSLICVAIDGRVVGLIGYSDGIRPESKSIVQKLRANGRRKIVLLSGDSTEVAQKIAREVGIDEVFGSLLPAQKADHVKKLKEQGSIVAMVGDGINDAPALALADVGISIAGSAEVAIETADVILLEGGLLRLPKAFAISDQAMARVKQNLGVIIIPNAIAIFLGAFGFINPAIAAMINNGATIGAVGIATLPLLWTPRRSLSVAPSLPLYEPKTCEIKEPQEHGVFVRIEEKYFLPKQNISFFKNEILKYLSKSSHVPGTQFTMIESVYFDSPDFQIFQMHFSRQERFKIRARRYAPNGISGDGSVHLEYKSKKNGVSRKARFQVGPEEFGLLWKGFQIPHSSPDSLRSLRKRNPDLEKQRLEERVRQINSLISKIELTPSCIVRYRREAFERDSLRLTIDDQIGYETTRNFSRIKEVLSSKPDVNSAAKRMHATFQDGEYLLVEVKHPGTIPSWLIDILKQSKCQKAKFSKYCYSVTEALLSEG